MNADWLIAGFDLLGDGPDSIRQLRKLVVGLAVSGRLEIPGPERMDPQAMAKAIDERRRALGPTGAVRQQAASAMVSAEELPAGFVDPARFVRLGSVARIEKGPTGIMKAKTGPYPLVVTAEERASCDRYDFDGTAAIIPLVSSAGHGKASLQRLHYQEGKFALGSILAAIFPYAPDLVSARFLYEYLGAFKDELLVSRMIGTANVSLSIGKIAEVPIPLVKPAIQRKVDELMALCDRLEVARVKREGTRTRLTTASFARLNDPVPDPAVFSEHARFVLDNIAALTVRPDQVTELRQTIFSLAVRGRLVPQDAMDEPASELLRRIAGEKYRLSEEGGLKKDKAAWEGLPKEPPYQLPPNWVWTRLQDVFEISRGGSPRPAGDPRYFGGPVPWITVREITKDGEKFLTHTESGLTDEGAARSRFINPGDLLLTNSGATLGVPKISKIRACMNDGVAVLRLFHAVNLNEFAYLYLHSQTDAFRKVNQGMGQPNLNTTIIAGWFFALPPLAEQYRITAKVNELMALCDRLQASLSRGEETRSRLLEAVLHKALRTTMEDAA